MLKGDTVRLVAEFRDFEYNSIIPNDVTLTIYSTLEEVIETITNVKVDGVIFYYDYVAESDFIYEFKGLNLGLPVLARKLQKVNFIRESGNC